MRLRSGVAPCVCTLAFASRSENADPAQTNADLGPTPSTDAAEPPSDGAP
jgi:hypothetical protein